MSIYSRTKESGTFGAWLQDLLDQHTSATVERERGNILHVTLAGREFRLVISQMNSPEPREDHELAACPFCASVPKSYWQGDSSESGDDGYWAIECCDVHVHRDDEAEAIAAWNTRASPVAESTPADATAEEAERLRRIAASADDRRGTDITHLSHEDRLRLARDL